MPGVLDKERIVAPPGYQRWLVPPAALCIHLCIGMAYGFSVFWLPLTRAVGVERSIPFPAGMSLFARLTTTAYDWDKSLLGWIYTLFFVCLGSSAALFGPWLERAGPRKAGVCAACCWSGGLTLAALGIYVHQLWIVWIGAGVIGGIGLGLGYISPVSTLIKWFPDRRGMATGLAIMGFGGGAMIGSPLAERLMERFASEQSVGVWQTFLVLAALYFAFMMVGAFAYRIPAPHWTPERTRSASLSQTAPANRTDRNQAAAVRVGGDRFVPAQRAWKTPQFWLLWLVLCLNVSAGIGVIGMASPMLQEMFGGRLIGVERAFDQLSPDQLRQVAAVGAGFTGLLSLFNIAGRFFWASISDLIGRKATYAIFFVLGCLAYVSIPSLGRTGSVPLFAAVLCLILTMYGGGFAAIPAYLADVFGTQMVGAIHGRLLTAWSVAGVLGPVLVNYWNEAQIRAGVPRSAAYDQTMYVLGCLLILGFVCNLMLRPVAERHFQRWEFPREVAGGHAASSADRALTEASEIQGPQDGVAEGTTAPSSRLVLIAFWAFVLLPLSWGVWMTLRQAGVMLFGFDRHS